MIAVVHLFAGLAETIGTRSIELELPDDATVSQLKQAASNRYPAAASLIQDAFAAVNQAYAGSEAVIRRGDEIALIPPVSGGDGLAEENAPAPDEPAYVLTREAISVEAVTGKVIDARHGAALTFVGTTREWTEGKRTALLEYEAYEPMALKSMEQIGREIATRWPGTNVAITHRLGRVEIAEISVVIAVSSPHRAGCYEASRYAIERLKQLVPIWKKEVWEDGSEWKGHQLGPWDPTAPIA